MLPVRMPAHLTAEFRNAVLIRAAGSSPTARQKARLKSAVATSWPPARKRKPGLQVPPPHAARSPSESNAPSSEMRSGGSSMMSFRQVVPSAPRELAAAWYRPRAAPVHWCAESRFGEGRSQSVDGTRKSVLLTTDSPKDIPVWLQTRLTALWPRCGEVLPAVRCQQSSAGALVCARAPSTEDVRLYAAVYVSAVLMP